MSAKAASAARVPLWLYTWRAVWGTCVVCGEPRAHEDTLRCAVHAPDVRRPQRAYRWPNERKDPAVRDADKVPAQAYELGRRDERVALSEVERTTDLIVSHRYPWCRARLLHALAGAEEQGVLEDALSELLDDEPARAAVRHALGVWKSGGAQ